MSLSLSVSVSVIDLQKACNVLHTPVSGKKQSLQCFFETVATIPCSQFIKQGVRKNARWPSMLRRHCGTSSSSHMRVIYHNWSAMKQRPHPKSVAEISHHSVLSGGRIRQCETSSGSRHKDTDQCL